MKIAFITQDFPPDFGGIQTYSLEIAKRLHLLCDDFVLIAPNKPNAKEVDTDLDFKVIRINSSNTLIGIACIPKVLKVLKEQKIDVLFHVQWQSLAVAAVAKRKGLVKKVICAVHARELFFNPFEKFKFTANFYESYKRRLVKKVDHFFPVSHYTSDKLEELLDIPASKRTVMINGTNPNLFVPKDKETLKKKYDCEGKMVISSISRLIERKAVDTVLYAIPEIVKEISNLHYLIVGDGIFKATLEKIVLELSIGKYVTFVGKVPYEEVSDFYNIADVFVMPSKLMLPEVEAFGIVYLEANACGTPAVGSRTGGVADAIIDGETGLLVEEQNPKELAKAVIRLLKNDELRLKLGKQGRKRVEEEANWEVICKKMYDLISILYKK